MDIVVGNKNKEKVLHSVHTYTHRIHKWTKRPARKKSCHIFFFNWALRVFLKALTSKTKSCAGDEVVKSGTEKCRQKGKIQRQKKNVTTVGSIYIYWHLTLTPHQ